MKKILILFMALLVLTGCNKEDKDNRKDEFNQRRTNYVSGIGTSTENKVVINYKNKVKEDCYYVFYIKGNSYDQKQIILHNNLESFNNAVNKYGPNTSYQLEKDTELYITEIYLRKNVIVREGKVIDVIKNKYKDSKYKIIYEK